MRVLAKLKGLYLSRTQVSDVGCTALATALNSGMLPSLERLYLNGIPASAAAKAAVMRHWQSQETRAPCPPDLCVAAAAITQRLACRTAPTRYTPSLMCVRNVPDLCVPVAFPVASGRIARVVLRQVSFGKSNSSLS